MALFSNMGGGNVLIVCLIRGASGQGFFPSIPQKELINFYWFCKCLFICKIALFLFCKLSNKYSRWWANEVCLSIVFIILLFAISGYVELWGAKNAMQYYILGFAAKKYNVFSRFKPKYMMILSLAAIIGLGVLRYSVSLPQLIKLTSLLLPLPIMVFVYYTFKAWLNKKIGKLTEVGKHSLLVYLLHIAFLSILTTSMKLAMDISACYHLWFWLALFVVLMALSLWAAKFVNNTPILRRIILLKKSEI